MLLNLKKLFTKQLLHSFSWVISFAGSISLIVLLINRVKVQFTQTLQEYGASGDENIPKI